MINSKHRLNSNFLLKMKFSIYFPPHQIPLTGLTIIRYCVNDMCNALHTLHHNHILLCTSTRQYIYNKILRNQGNKHLLVLCRCAHDGVNFCDIHNKHIHLCQCMIVIFCSVLQSAILLCIVMQSEKKNTHHLHQMKQTDHKSKVSERPY